MRLTLLFNVKGTACQPIIKVLRRNQWKFSWMKK